MPHARHRLQFLAAVLGTVGVVYGFSRLIRPHAPAPPIASAVAFEPAPIVPRVDPPLEVKGVARVSAAFLAAVNEGDLPTLERLYVKGMVLDGTLSAAAATGKIATVRWLLDHGADVHEAEGELEAPVVVADPHADVVRLLLDRGAADSSLSTACLAGAPNAVTRLLPKLQASPTALHDALSSTLATPENKLAIVTKLLAAGADPNADDGAPMGAAIGACASSDETTACVPLIQALVARGARVSGDHLASAVDLDPPVIDVLLGAKLEPGATSVALAQASDPAVIKKIAARGVVWAWHAGEGDEAIPLASAIDRADVDAVRALLEAGAPAEMHLGDGRSPLGQALERAGSDTTEGARIVDLLLARGARVNRRLSDGRTPLIAAAELGEPRIVTALLDHGARVNERVLEETALDAAERNGNVAAARILHARGGRRVLSAASDRPGR